MKQLFGLLFLLLPLICQGSPQLTLNDQEYFTTPGLDVTVFADVYPDGHQTGVTIIQHGKRVAANGDIRLEASPGQWSPVPKSIQRSINAETQEITQTLSYPDHTKDRKGFNPIEYPDLKFTYQVRVQPLKNNRFKIVVDLNKPLPDDWIGKVGFNFELFPGELFGKSYRLGNQVGYFTRQPNGPISDVDGVFLGAELGRGKQLVVAPEEDLQRIKFESKTGDLVLLDGRTNHNNGWFIVRSLIAKGATKNAVEWIVSPNVVDNWQYQPVLQVSQVGYASKQAKHLVIEQDKRDKSASAVTIYEITDTGKKAVFKAPPKIWGPFLRYQYMVLDFTHIDKPGMYVAEYRNQYTHPFKIGNDVFSRHVWQPTLEYFLPAQMCHMRVEEKYRVWHDLCHHDDARMSPVNLIHFDGYSSKASTLTHFKPGERVPNLNRGGWHDAGDYDLRVESQAGTIWLLSAMVEEFNLTYDATSIDQNKDLVFIHQPDGVSDALQQIEHGLLSVMGGYLSMGRLYRGIIVPTIPQYVMLGDAASQTDGIPYVKKAEEPKSKDSAKEVVSDRSDKRRADDRWVFTEENPARVLHVVGALANAARVIKDYNPKLAKATLEAAQKLYQTNEGQVQGSAPKVFALTELILSTQDKTYINALVAMEQDIINNIAETGWRIARVKNNLQQPEFLKNVGDAIAKYQAQLQQEATQTPYGVPYKPNIWGAGWGIQEFGVRQYFMHKAWPEHATPDLFLNALNFILGVHPGENTISFASGVGANSALVAYGVNRADWSFIPGGVISGTALIRPDLPELKTWPFFWQQTEYVMGGGATNFMFLALAAQTMYE